MFWLEDNTIHFSDRYEGGAKRQYGRELSEAEAMLLIIAGTAELCTTGGVCGPIRARRNDVHNV
jgi:hypothetical protein